MAKKARAGGGEPTAATPVPTRESLQRISYLVQASVLLRSVIPALPSSEAARRSKKRRTKDVQAPARPPTIQETAGDETTADVARPERNEKNGAGAPLGQPEHRQSKRARPDKALQPVANHLASEISSVGKKATVRM